MYVEFVIEADGSITNAKVIRGIGSGCDEETVRVVNTMPNWTPGNHKGKNVRVKYVLPAKLSDLMKWHLEDTVDDWERNRDTIPIISATKRGNSASILFCSPNKVKTLIPIASKRNKVLLKGATLLLNRKTQTTAPKITQIYAKFPIQFIGCESIRTSLTIPPPTAVTNAIITTPNKSNPCLWATNAPLSANANVPIKSKAYIGFKEYFFRVCN